MNQPSGLKGLKPYQDWAILVSIKTVIALYTVASAQNGIIFQKLITLVADVQKLHILY